MEADRTSKFTAGDAYDVFMGRYAVPLAPLMADLAGVVAGQRALDVGCGTGALTGELVRRLGAAHVVGCDPSAELLATCRAKYPDVDLCQALAEALPYPDHSFDVALAQLTVQFTTDPRRAAGEMRRVVRPGGLVAVCEWDVDRGMQMLHAFWDAAASIDPGAPDERLTMRFGRAGQLTTLLDGTGIVDVSEVALEVGPSYVDFDELWSTLLLGVGPPGSYLVNLPEDQRAALRTAYLDVLGYPEGPFTLRAVARAAVGTVGLSASGVSLDEP